ncbi:MAG: ABC transporter ATP-binding protein, partial [Rhizobiales bacterium]|nr:ABC transporter ATP-binding protein [Hyphomicrobiales bacterium]
MHGNTCAGHEPSKPPALSFEAVTKRFGAPTVIDDLSIDIRQSEFFALLGPSGCGKSTLLRIAAGFERPNSGRVLIDGGDVTDMPPHLRPVNMMFQSYALFPHMSVAENIAFGLKQERCDRATITERVTQALALLQLAPLAQRRPDQLSGGQRQRVALARALVKRPRVLLLDEPLGALDKKLRDEMQGELAALQRRLGTTFVIVTHDQEEALTLADRIAVLDRGRIAQVGTPSEIYDRPASLSVARFMGDINLIEGRVAAADEDATTVDCGGIGRLAVAGRSGIPAGDA